MNAVTYEEQQLMALYDTGTRPGLIRALREMRLCLSPEDADLRTLTDSAIEKLEAMSDEEYAALDLTPDFDEEEENAE